MKIGDARFSDSPCRLSDAPEPISGGTVRPPQPHLGQTGFSTICGKTGPV